MQQEALAIIIFISWWIPWSCIEQAGRFVSQGPDCTHSDCVHTIFDSLCCYFPCTAPYLKRLHRSPQGGAIFYQLDWFSIAVFFWKVWFLSWFSLAFVLKVWLWCSFLFLFFFFRCRTYCEGLSSQEQCKDLISGWTEKRWHDANIAKHDSCRCRATTISAMVGISGVWWCNGDSKTHGFVDYAHPDCLWPLKKQRYATGCSAPGCFFS